MLNVLNANGSSIISKDNIGHLNPIRYRGYYYDDESGFYYLQSRYYDPQTRRFINADDINVVSVTLDSITDKNLYAYCDNNPIIRKDTDGYAFESIFDVLSLGASIVEVVFNPADPWAWLGLAGDVVDLVPFVTCVGETIDGLKVANKIDDIGTYRDLRKINKGNNKEVHHIVEKRFADKCDELRKMNKNDIYSIALDKSNHRDYTNEWRYYCKYGQKYNVKDVMMASIKIYRNDPKMLGAAIYTITKYYTPA